MNSSPSSSPSEVIRTVHFDGDGYALSPEQRELALSLAQCKLLEDPAVRKRLWELQQECLKQVSEAVQAENNLPSLPRYSHWAPPS